MDDPATKLAIDLVKHCPDASGVSINALCRAMIALCDVKGFRTKAAIMRIVGANWDVTELVRRQRNKARKQAEKDRATRGLNA